ncbi:MAG: PDZ domain-containing protein [candidate division WOR-3 bacterium]|nr:MAG: PDZ domain-containing protein [candidate division WOR-3 bacterium]
MRTKSLLISICSFVLVFWIHGQSQQIEGIAEAESANLVLNEAVEEAISVVKPALVRIHAVSVFDRQGREIKRESSGSGVIIDKDGHVVTNHHVAGRAIRLRCTLFSREEIEADVVGTDPLSDICVIKLRDTEKHDFSFVKFGNSNALKVGEKVLAMGSPLALSQSVTMGIVSNTEMVMPDVFRPFKLTLEGEDVGSIVRWIGHDAPIYPGNSGGPLVNLKGEVVGINEISFGIAGAIPANLAQDVVRQLIDSGKVTRSWVGIEVQPLLESYEGEAGALVSSVIDGSPAADAGFVSGDILVQFADEDVTVRFNEELPLVNQLLMNCEIGKKVKAIVLRDGKRRELTVIPREREYIWPRPVEIKRWGITARDISLMAAKELKRDSQDGVLVTSVRPGGPCGKAEPALIRNDVITGVNGKKIREVGDLVQLTEEISVRKGKAISILVAFERKDSRYVTAVKLDTTSLEDQGKELEKAWLGIETQVLTRDLSDVLGIQGYKGVRVTQVFEKSAAENAGVRVGDIIIAVNDEQIEASMVSDIGVLPVMLRRYDIGSKVSLTVLRNKKKVQLSAVLGSSPATKDEMKKYTDENFEFTARDIAFEDRVDQRWDLGQRGVLVENVSEGSWAALANLEAGDLIRAVDGKEIDDIDAFSEIMGQIAKEKRKHVVFHVLRGIHNMFIELVPSWASDY